MEHFPYVNRKCHPKGGDVGHCSVFLLRRKFLTMRVVRLWHRMP